jgi:hypothetical protein
VGGEVDAAARGVMSDDDSGERRQSRAVAFRQRVEEP